MNTPLALALTVTAAVTTAGCGTLDPFAEQDVVEAKSPPPAPEPVDWVLIAPPDDRAVMILMDNLDRLPADVDAMPAQPVDGVPQADWTASRVLVSRMVDQGPAEARARFLAERSVVAEAPRERWRRVRRFDEKGKCEWTLNELRAITAEESAKIVYRPGMRMADLQYLLLRASWNEGDCVPADEPLPAASS